MWLYFDAVAFVATRALVQIADVEARNRLARDAYSHLHFPLVAGIALVALGLHEALAHVDEPLAVEPAAALLGGTALYLLGHVGFNRRSTGSTKAHRLVAAVVLVLLVPVGTQVDALAAVALTTATILLLIAYENARYADARREIRRAMLLHGHGGSGSGSGATVPPAR